MTKTLNDPALHPPVDFDPKEVAVYRKYLGRRYQEIMDYRTQHGKRPEVQLETMVEIANAFIDAIQEYRKNEYDPYRENDTLSFIVTGLREEEEEEWEPLFSEEELSYLEEISLENLTGSAALYRERNLREVYQLLGRANQYLIARFIYSRGDVVATEDPREVKRFAELAKLPKLPVRSECETSLSGAASQAPLIGELTEFLLHLCDQKEALEYLLEADDPKCTSHFTAKVTSNNAEEEPLKAAARCFITKCSPYLYPRRCHYDGGSRNMEYF